MFPVHDRHEYHDEDSNWYHRYTHLPENLPHTTHSPLFTPHSAAASNEGAAHQNPAFNGLLHPDNIVNHHHFLPHEANKQEKPARSSQHAPHHVHGYRVHGFDRNGNRQEVSRQVISGMKFVCSTHTITELNSFNKSRFLTEEEVLSANLSQYTEMVIKLKIE